MESPQTPMGGNSMWSTQASPPTSGTRMCGIGCSINVNDWGELIIRRVVAGGPAAFSCEIACDDVLLQVDGVSVVGETPEEVAKRIVGPEGMPITIMIRFKSFLEGRETWIEKVVALIRQPTVHMPERLSEGRVGIGVEVVPEQGKLQVRRLQPGGPSATSGKLKVGDSILKIDSHDIAREGGNVDVGCLLSGAPFSRVSLLVASPNSPPRPVYMVRGIVLLGEFLMKQTAYLKAQEHAILQPSPPLRNETRNNRSWQEQEEAPNRGSDSPSLHSSDFMSSVGAGSRGSSGCESLDGMMSRSSTASRDSISPLVRQQFGDDIDSLRTVEGRTLTFVTAGRWPHSNNPKLFSDKMANAGFVFAPEQGAGDRVICVYCGLELADWEDEDDPWSAHQDSAPGCSFWRKSSTVGQRLSKELFNGYGSPYHSVFRSASSDQFVEWLKSYGRERAVEEKRGVSQVSSTPTASTTSTTEMSGAGGGGEEASGGAGADKKYLGIVYI